MRVFVSLETLSRRVNRCAPTLRARLKDGTLVPDAVVIAGGKQSVVFDSERVGEIRRTLTVETSPEVVL